MNPKRCQRCNDAGSVCAVNDFQSQVRLQKGHAEKFTVRWPAHALIVDASSLTPAVSDTGPL